LLASVALVNLVLLVRGASGRPVVAELGGPAASPLLANPLLFVAGAAVTQGTVALVVAVTLWVRRLNWRAILPFTRAAPGSYAGTLLVVFGLAPFAQLVGELTSRIFKLETKASIIVSHMAESSSLPEFVLLLAALSILPALAEEGMFRGYVTAAYSRHHTLTRLIVPSILFGMFHLEPTQASATVVLGVGFALGRVYSGSLLPSMVAHCLYNGAVLTVARNFPDADDHTIRWEPLFVGGALFAIGLALLLKSRAMAESPDPARV
jgi:membrane protease YdiL (CAAX protease family)